MSAVQSSLPISESGIPVTLTFDQLSSSQQAVLRAVALVPNVRDEQDVQCLLFLAEEFGVLRSNPFYFSVQHMEERTLPCSLVLRDALRGLFEHGLIGLREGMLAVRQFGQQARSMVANTVSAAWLAALSPDERYALAEAVLALRAQGATVRARATVPPFRQTLTRALGVEAADLLEGRLNALYWQRTGL